jgi:two-component system cell cycle sensor histidine kinase/response regulator CckA
LKTSYAPVLRHTNPVLFPGVDAPTERQLTQPLPVVDRHASGTVLVIDHEEDVRTVIARMAKRLGFRVRAAPDGQTGGEVLRTDTESIDCVLLDMTMSQLRAEEALRAIRQARSQVPVVLMSAYPEQELIGRFAEAGLAGFLQKPFTLDELQARLQGVVGARAASRR